MVKFSAEDLRVIMDKKNKIMDKKNKIGKSTFTDSLVAPARIIAQEVAGDVRMTDTRANEPEPAVANLKRGGATWKDIIILVEGAIILVQALVFVILLSNLM
ncbi:hypothetical protein BDA96_01G022000 [Sorghum bicolor]|uniref:Uncharacterized protein n=2 Tax=Sorghum bicolor TaxID=4558 RepID=A0A1B6QGX8_SORBI|nr:hypothetical protein BDA96_01G022000 [Sorghum bicolor]KXG37182.1 hypothetical protein SORBI_3001G021200 [Sorghum bicolor]